MSQFSLELPNEEEIKAGVEAEAVVSPEDEAKITALVESTGAKIVEVDLSSAESRHDCIEAIESFGLDAVRRTEGKNAILQKRMYQFSEAGDETGEVSKGLADLTIRMRDLDPSKVDFLKTGKLGRLFSPARRYFERFKTADQEIAAIIRVLENGRKTLVNDCTTLELEESAMRELTLQLAQNIQIAMGMDAYIERAILDLEVRGGQEDKIKFLREEVLYPLRQKITDFQQLLVVNQQGIIAMEIIRRNNRELIRSVDRAKLVTVSALRTAVTVAGALYDQRIVLEKINALNAETNRMIAATSQMLHEQGTAIHTQAEESGVSVETLTTAFNEALEALNEISTYKQEALPRLKANIEEFRVLAEEGEKRIRQLEAGGSGTDA